MSLFRSPWARTFGVVAPLLLAGAIAVIHGPDIAAPTEGSVEVFAARLDERVVELMQAYDVPGAAISLVRGGEVVWSGAYGYANLATGRSMTVETVNRAESISKSVTAWGVMTLVERGQIRLDDPLSRHLSDRSLLEAAHVEDVTIRQLLSHTGGLALGTIGIHYPPDGDVPSLSETLTEEVALESEPGAGFLYSNVGFNVLEMLIEEVTGEDFASYMAREVLEPLGMNRSSYAWSDIMNPPVPVGYELDGAPVPVYVYPERASGGLFAPVEDIARFVAAGMTAPDRRDHRVLRIDSIERLYGPMVDVAGIFGFVTDSYGLGYFVESLSDGRRAVWHGGQGHGWMTHFHSVPATGDGIVILTNSQRSWPMIAGLLGDWSDWSGLPPVGMTFISRANTILWVVIGVLAVLSLAQLWRVASGLASRRHRLAPLSRRSRALRAVQALTALFLAVGLWVGVVQDVWSFFMRPVFPTAAVPLAVSLVTVAVALLSSALAPRETVQRMGP